jgi:hypothetical protein
MELPRLVDFALGKQISCGTISQGYLDRLSPAI